MKNIRKVSCLVLAIAIIFAMSISAFATEEKGSITIENPVENQTYDVYLMFELESYDATSGAYSYKITDAWADFVNSDAIGSQYFTVSTAGYVTKIVDTAVDTADLAKAALAYVASKGISATATITPVKSGDVVTAKAEELSLGYYLVDSSLGALCGLTTTKPDATITEKNEAPAIDKLVQENSTSDWGKTNNASIGDTVNFKTTISAKHGAIGYVVHDVMSEGLTLLPDTIAVAGAVKDTDYTVATALSGGDGCTFEITFSQAYLDKITADTDIVITYSAILNENALISTSANPNKTKLSYGDESNSETEWSETNTYTYKFDLVKTKNDNKILEGAEFKLYDAQTGGNEIALVKEADGTYRVATAAEKVEGFNAAIIEVGHTTIKGLDSGVYYLEEITAPTGYNLMKERVEVKIEDANLDAELEGDVWTEGGVQVINQTGAELPSTGGIGTRIFYVVGSIMVIAAAVLLVTKKRMSSKG